MLVMIARLAENQYQKSKLKGIFLSPPYQLHCPSQFRLQAAWSRHWLGQLQLGIGLDNAAERRVARRHRRKHTANSVYKHIQVVDDFW